MALFGRNFGGAHAGRIIAESGAGGKIRNFGAVFMNIGLFAIDDQMGAERRFIAHHVGGVTAIFGMFQHFDQFFLRRIRSKIDIKYQTQGRLLQIDDIEFTPVVPENRRLNLQRGARNIQIGGALRDMAGPARGGAGMDDEGKQSSN